MADLPFTWVKAGSFSFKFFITKSSCIRIISHNSRIYFAKEECKYFGMAVINCAKKYPDLSWNSCCWLKFKVRFPSFLRNKVKSIRTNTWNRFWSNLSANCTSIISEAFKPITRWSNFNGDWIFWFYLKCRKSKIKGKEIFPQNTAFLVSLSHHSQNSIHA